MIQNQSALLNQHQLAAKLRRSRASIVSWQREGLPIAQRGGHGRPTLYDLDQVLTWLKESGRGSRVTLPPLPRPDVQTDAASALHPAERLLGSVLEEGVVSITATLLAHGIPGEAALSVFDGLIVATYALLEERIDRAEGESLIPLGGALGLLMEDAGREKLLELARQLATSTGADWKNDELARAMRQAH